jgi:hypothetical protein
MLADPVTRNNLTIDTGQDGGKTLQILVKQGRGLQIPAKF